MTEINTSPAKGIVVRGRWLRNLLTYLMVFGPGLIVMEADNDAGAVSTYVQAGAQYGTTLLWLMLLLLPITYFVQEMVARLGIATGQGHAAMIFKRFGRWWGIFSLFDLLLVNFLTLVTEFAGISLAFSAMGVSPYESVPIAAGLLIAMVMTGSYCRWEWFTICLCLLDLIWFGLAWATQTNTGQVIRDTVIPQVPPGGVTPDLVFLVIGIVGTTIAPWQLFFQQSCVADKKLRFSDLKWARLDTFIGACFTVLVGGAMMLVGNLGFQHHINFTDPAQLAGALVPFLGQGGRIAILLLMCNAAILGATAISLASAWAWSEVMGWPHSLRRSVRQSPGFYAVYALCVCAAAGLVLIPNAPLQTIIIGVQVLAGVILPSAIIFLQLLLNDRELLGDEFVNKPWNNVINWTVIVVLFILSLILAAQVLAPELFPKTSS
ncbi:MAG: Nramp family divalent metal transporter [Chroococcidiopsidaceae cyanobacterium CP_BM_ER_R8_30]|nr:Nramp family divalent metal transporter [Chroococcidiopsidaceae cyanobacterium CP_BM_ER_R8_30]